VIDSDLRVRQGSADRGRVAGCCGLTPTRWSACGDVAQLNAGRKTAGIDGKTALLPQEKTDLVAWVQRESSSWTPRAVKRVFIPKAGGKQRPLGIPTDASHCPELPP
jgi:hypothetical protein